MTKAAIAEDVDHDRVLEPLPELGRDFRGVDDGLRIVAVGVEDRRFHHLGDIGRIRRRAGDRGSVVKPIWLLTMKCTVPPVR